MGKKLLIRNKNKKTKRTKGILKDKTKDCKFKSKELKMDD